jgi:hypothetical protein
LPKLTIKDVDSRLDGEYECQLDDLTNRELHFVRQTSGIAPAGIIGGLLSEDAGITVALASVVLEREGKAVDVEALWDAQHGDIMFDFSRDGDDEVPPGQPPSGGNDPDNDGGTSGASASSGAGSRKSSATPRRGRKATSSGG